MITLIHGDDTQSSRTEFIVLKKRGGEVRSLDGRTLDEAALTQALTSESLFGGNVTVCIENLFGKLGRKTKLIESLTAIIKKSDVDVVLWEDKELGSLVLKNLGNVNVRLFKLPTVLFQFLDSLTLPLYQKLDKPELVHAMLVRRVRQLIQIRDGAIPTGLQSWQAAKLTRQAKLFTMNRLLSMYQKLLAIEYSVKSGTSPFTLRQATEQFLLNL